MKVTVTHCHRPYHNLAMEEYLLRNTDEEYFLLWRNERSIIVGKNQNTLAEINADYVREHQLPVARRITGGGAVFHDLGNLNYTFIRRNAADSFRDYALFAAPVIETLAQMGVRAELSGRNDLLVDGQKISGNAQCMVGKSVMHHGCLLFDADVSSLSEALRVNPLKIQSKGIASVRSRVTNIASHLPAPCTVEEFASRLRETVLRTLPGAEAAELTARQLEAIDRLEREKFSTWEWNYGFRRPFTHRVEKKFDGGIVDAGLQIEEDRVRSARFYGDYFGKKDVAELEQALIGIPYREDALREVLSRFCIEDYFTSLTVDDLIGLLV